MKFADLYEQHEDEVVDLTPQESDEEPSEAPKSDEDSGGGHRPPSEMGSAVLGDYFGYSARESQSSEMKSKLDEIYLMVSSMGFEDVKDYLNDVENKIGEPKLGVSRIDHVYQYLKLMDNANQAYNKVENYGNKSSAGKQEQQDTIRAPEENDEGVSGGEEVEGDS